MVNKTGCGHLKAVVRPFDVQTETVLVENRMTLSIVHAISAFPFARRNVDLAVDVHRNVREDKFTVVQTSRFPRRKGSAISAIINRSSGMSNITYQNLVIGREAKTVLVYDSRNETRSRGSIHSQRCRWRMHELTHSGIPDVVKDIAGGILSVKSICPANMRRTEWINTYHFTFSAIVLPFIIGESRRICDTDGIIKMENGRRHFVWWEHERCRRCLVRSDRFAFRNRNFFECRQGCSECCEAQHDK